jgi:general secretion pathway protein G
VKVQRKKCGGAVTGALARAQFRAAPRTCGKIPDARIFHGGAGGRKMAAGGRRGMFVGERRNAQGFTLLELLVVVMIIGLLAGFVAPRYFGQIGKSEVATARAQIDALEKALDQYRLDVGRYPSTELGLNALLVRPVGEAKWNGPYLRKDVPLDPWGKPYVYKIPGEKSEFDLLSYGKDGRPGGSGEDADLSNH